MTRGLLFLLVGTGLVLFWASSQQSASSSLGTADTNAAQQPNPTGDLNNQSGTYSSGVNPGGQ